jgi:hypothetical protein
MGMGLRVARFRENLWLGQGSEIIWRVPVEAFFRQGRTRSWRGGKVSIKFWYVKNFWVRRVVFLEGK